MTKPNKLQWTNGSRRQLYAVLKASVDAGALDWNTLLRKALKRSTTEHFLENFRTGRIAVRHAVQIYDLLTNSYPSVASEFEAAFQSPPVWEDFILRHRMLGSLELQPPDGLQYPSRMPTPDAAAHSRSVIVMDRPKVIDFHLDQNLRWADSAIALYAAGNQWFPMLLQPMENRPDGRMKMRVPVAPEALIVPVMSGAQEIQSGTLSDADHPASLIRFLMIVSERSLLVELSGNWMPGSQIPGSELSNYPARLSATHTPWALHQVNTTLLPHAPK